MHTSRSQARLFGLAFAVTSVLFAHSSHALRFTPGSACESYCSSTPDTSSSTSTIKTSEIVCSNKDYWSSTTGTQYRNCLNCLQNSTAVNETQSDVEWYLYNLRYSLDVCLYAYPSSDAANSSETSTCASSSGCQSLRTALETGITRPSNGTQFDYCTASNSAFSTSLETCQQCLQTDANQSYFSNFLTALDAGCKQQPPVGNALGLNGTLFSTVAMSIVNPSWNHTASNADSDSSSLSQGTIIGIVAGAGALFISALFLFYLYWRKQRGSQHHTQDITSPRFKRHTPLGYRALLDNTSTTSGGFTPFYTTDYKGATASKPNSTMFEHLKPQHVVLPNRQPNEVNSAGVPVSSKLWGRDTPTLNRQQMRDVQNYTTTQQIITPAVAVTESRDSFSTARDNASSIYQTAQGLDEMPTHPAFMPRAFTRPSRNPINVAQPPPPIKAYRPDEYVAQHYIDALREATSVDVTNLIMQPPPALGPYQREMSQFAAPNTANSFASRGHTPQMSSEETSIASSAASLRNRSISPMSSSVPLIKTPTPPRGRTAKRNVPPPIDTERVRTKAPRMQHQLSHEL